jgi:hypothetical protein
MGYAGCTCVWMKSMLVQNTRESSQPGGRSHAPDVCHMDRNSRRQLYRTYAEVVQWVLCVREESTCLAIRLEGAM